MPTYSNTVQNKGLRLLQWISFIALAAISLYFTSNLALGLGTNQTEKIAMLGGSLAIELLKLYLLVVANTARVAGRKGRATAFYASYAFIASYSLMACFGYALTTVDRLNTTTVTASHQEDLTLEERNLSLYDEAITSFQMANKSKQEAIAILPADRLNRKMEINHLMTMDQPRIEALIQKRETSRNRIASWRAEDLQSAANHKRTMYQVLGEALRFPAKWIAFGILSIFSLAIEMGIIITSPHATVSNRVVVAQTLPEVKARTTPKAPAFQEVLVMAAAKPSAPEAVLAFFRQSAPQKPTTANLPATGTFKVGRKNAMGRVGGYLTPQMGVGV